ncbi:Biosynthetic arginine decarboxylase [hydrothermal vent metagenome]|uniref:arginine decarboxylase n=1 Tax=hydrothermal vent metagenome TaxID=652676 RepID=A0A3B0YL87_9ZZZZ
MSESVIESARRRYNLPGWSNGYFDVNAEGHLFARIPCSGEQAEVDLYALSQEIRAAGLRFPVLVRCTDLLHHRVTSLCAAFRQAMHNHDYPGNYTAVYPIKVNQQFSVVKHVINADAARVGLEAGSKPELMAVLGLAQPGSVVVCNGYKDRAYIRLALMGHRLGLRLYLVVEKLSELELIIEQAAALGVRPLLGVRVRMASVGTGNWQNSGGAKSKFGLRTAQVLEMVERLRRADLLEQLQMMHFHLGSQLTNIADIQAGVSEAAHVYADLRALGAPLDALDVGGGLGVDYEGTASRSFCSMNYTLEQYAEAVVSGVSKVCEKGNLPRPMLLTESGRAITAHHAFMITNVIDTEESPAGEPQPILQGAVPDALNTICDLHAQPERHAIRETWKQARKAMVNIYEAYSNGVLTLEQRATGEQYYYAILQRLRGLLQAEQDEHRDVRDVLNELLADKYFCNLSIFQSLPDVWALDQVFPIVPLHRLDEVPTRRASLEDLTCDSDGRIDHYVDGESIEHTLPVHAIVPGEEYLLGFFMVGAYQEILGDMHNLFGDTDAVDITINKDGSHRLSHAEAGDRVDELLRYVHFDPEQLRHAYRDLTEAAGLNKAEATQYLSEMEAGLTAYTYLDV